MLLRQSLWYGAGETLALLEGLKRCRSIINIRDYGAKDFKLRLCDRLLVLWRHGDPNQFSVSCYVRLAPVHESLHERCAYLLQWTNGDRIRIDGEIFVDPVSYHYADETLIQISETDLTAFPGHIFKFSLYPVQEVTLSHLNDPLARDNATRNCFRLAELQEPLRYLAHLQEHLSLGDPRPAFSFVRKRVFIHESDQLIQLHVSYQSFGRAGQAWCLQL